MGFKHLLINKIERDGLRLIHHMAPVPAVKAETAVAEIYAEIRQGFGFLVPPIVLHAPVPALLAGVWRVARTVLLNGRQSQQYREAISAAVSQANACPFCVEVHGMALHALGDHYSGRAIEAAKLEQLVDPKLRALVRWASAVNQPQAPIIQQPPFARTEAAEMIGLVVVFQYINRMVNIFLEKSALPAAMQLRWVKARIMRVMGIWVVRDLLSNTGEYNEVGGVVTDRDLPEDMNWAVPETRIASVFVEMMTQVERGGEEVLVPTVRELVLQRLAKWQGEAMPLGQGWLDKVLQEIEVEERPAARLALLTAFASYRVDTTVIEDFRRLYPMDSALLKATAWASFAAARRVGGWLLPHGLS